MAARVNSFSTYLGTTKNTVQYVDKAGNSIDGVTSTSFIANAGDTLTVDAKATNVTTSGTNVTAGVPAIPGYKFTGLVVTDAQGNKTSYSATDVANIVMTSDSTITFNYAKMSSDTFTITDQDGNAVTVPGAQTTYTVGGDDTSVDGTAYTSSVSGYTAVATVIAGLTSKGFKFVSITGADGKTYNDLSALKFGGSDAAYKIVVAPDTQSTTIHYIDANGKEISKVVNATAKVGSTLTPALVKSGYVYNSTTTKANAKNAGLAVDSAANYVVTKGVSDVYYTYNSYGVVLNVQKAGGKTVNMMGDGKAIPVASTQSSIADLLSLGSATSFTAAEKLLKQYGLVPAGYTLSGAQINGKAVDMAASFDLANFLVDGTSYVTDTADGTADSVATLLLLLTPSKQSATVTAVDSEGKSLGQEIGVITGDTDSSFTDAAANLKYPEIAGYTRVVTPLTDANGATSFDETNNALDADDASQQTIKVIYVLNPAQAGADKNVNVTADVTDAQAAFDKAVNATDATPSSVADGLTRLCKKL